jgi:hypothetical protein
MSNSDFLKNTNVNMLWDVISDEEIFQVLSRESQSEISQIFIKNINGFFEIERKKTQNLVEINKKYIILILNHIKTNYPKKVYNKIKIFNEAPVKELITYEEIQNEKKSQFDKDYERMQEEFTNSVTLKVPEVPEFADKYEDKPISEMDKIIKEMTAKRNYEVEQINRNYQVDVNSTNNWLKPQETSIKTEKLNPNQSQEPAQNQNYSKSKYINTFENLEIPNKKNVSWGDNNEIISNDEDNELETNIFKKLKKVDKPELQNNISLTIKENTNEDRILNVETEIKIINNKLDMVINLLNSKFK